MIVFTHVEVHIKWFLCSFRSKNKIDLRKQDWFARIIIFGTQFSVYSTWNPSEHRHISEIGSSLDRTQRLSWQCTTPSNVEPCNGVRFAFLSSGPTISVRPLCSCPPPVLSWSGTLVPFHLCSPSGIWWSYKRKPYPYWIFFYKACEML